MYMDKELDKLKSVLKIQTFLKHTMYQFNKCIEKKNNIFYRINELVSKTEQNYNIDIFNQEKYNMYMENMETLLKFYYEIPFIKKNSFNFKLSYINILAKLTKLNEKLTIYEKKFGHISFINILKTIQNWESFFTESQKQLLLHINLIFIPLEFSFSVINNNVVHKKRYSG